MKTTLWAIVIAETGVKIEMLRTREDAIKALLEQEEIDMDEGIYEPGTYEIQEIQIHK